MDQIKTFLSQAMKYRFWILCTVVVIVGLTGWYMATGNLDETAKKSAEAIKSADQKVKQVTDYQLHPNDEYTAGMNKIINVHSISIGRGWQFRYAQQKDLLLWPKHLGPEFHAAVNPLRPIEEHVSFDSSKGGYLPDQEIDPDLLEIYRNFILDELPNLSAIIGAKWYVKEASGAGAAGGVDGVPGLGAPTGRSTYGGASDAPGSGLEEEEDTSIVFWAKSNQQEILDLHFPFTAQAAVPHTLDVLYAQEDLWVLEAILNVIKRTNGDADANYNAAIKEIVSIQMGRTVRGRMGKVSPVVEAQVSASGAMGGSTSYGVGIPDGPAASTPMPTATDTSGAQPSMPGSSTMPGAATSAAVLDPAFGRYVDIDYNPLPPTDLRAARESTDPKLAIYSVAKRMPVRMRFFMDQRKLSDLLAECGNSSLPIEVRQVRINCPAGLASDNQALGGTSDGSTSYSSTMPGAPAAMPSSSTYSTDGASTPGSSRRSQRSSMGSESTYGPSSGGALGGGMDAEDPNEIEVEVYGIVHIYNPVNEKQLNIELRQLDEGAAPTATPTAVAPTVVPPRG